MEFHCYGLRGCQGKSIEPRNTVEDCQVSRLDIFLIGAPSTKNTHLLKMASCQDPRAACLLHLQFFSVIFFCFHFILLNFFSFQSYLPIYRILLSWIFHLDFFFFWNFILVFYLRPNINKNSPHVIFHTFLQTHKHTYMYNRIIL